MSMQRNITKCPICDRELVQPSQQMENGSGYHFDCPYCGTYQLENKASVDIGTYKISLQDNTEYIPYAIRRMSSGNQGVPFLSSETLKQLYNAKFPLRPSPFEQADNLIRHLGNTPFDIGRRQDVDLENTCAITGSQSYFALRFVVESLKADGLIDTENRKHNLISCQLTFKGWARYEKLKKGAASGETAFLAMKYGEKELKDVVDNCFRPAVKQTGYQLRELNDPDLQRAGLIDDRLRVEIKAAQFVISDLTHQNEGAYWEAGYAEGLGKPVIYTCEKSVFEKREGGTHFDTNHHLHILWTSDAQDEVAEELKACIRATIPEAKQTD